MKVIRLKDLCEQGILAQKRVLIRADLNVPQDEKGNITEDTRIRSSLQGIQMALDAGAAVMVTSHLGRPIEGLFREEDSLLPVAKRMSELLGRKVPVVRDWINGVQLQPGQLVMLENCRFNVGEKITGLSWRKKWLYCVMFLFMTLLAQHTELRRQLMEWQNLRLLRVLDHCYAQKWKRSVWLWPVLVDL